MTAPVSPEPTFPDGTGRCTKVVDGAQCRGSSTHSPPHDFGPTCRCHQSFAYVTPIHAGHCCFFPAGKTCHPAEVAVWEQERKRRNRVLEREVSL